ncbi:hypothetical protein [Streptomyces sp. M41(2017)]|uniref:hypothetical protein n=1 Tax=Streptomyces sp. M41(2017) TaxID=1955065 RepID=UPI00117F3C4A|nr:hypothetical protein [Streptomyces sp. M41(2017)]
MSVDEAVRDHLNRIFYEDLGLCGCGNPDEAYVLVRDLLSLAPYYENEGWRLAETLTGGGAAHHIIMSVIDVAELTEHGSSVNGAWLTPKGAWCLQAMRTVSFEEMSEGGLPHEGRDCTDACWALPTEEAAA